MEKVSADQMGTLVTLGAAAVGSLLVIVVNCIHGLALNKIFNTRIVRRLSQITTLARWICPAMMKKWHRH